MPQAQPLNDDNFLTADHPVCEHSLPATLPRRPTSGPPVGLTLSGGGFRATFASLGVVRYLADVGLLENLWMSSSVSGGSVANGIIARHWPELRTRGFTADAVDALLIDPTVKRVAEESLKSHLIKNVWRTVGRKNRTDLLGWAFDKWFMGDFTLDQLDPSVRWVINAANMATGTRFTFERTMLGDYVNGFVSTDDAKVPVALAAATSAAVPGAFAPIELKHIDFPCRGDDTVSLLDGGAYDNTGIEVLNSPAYDDVFTICLAAGGLFKIGPYGKIPLVRDLKQANSVLYRQSRALRTRDMVQRFVTGERQGLVFKLNTTQTAVERQLGSDDAAIVRVRAFCADHPTIDFYNDLELAYSATSFDQFDEGLSRRLIYKGWWTAGLTMAAFHPAMATMPAGTSGPQV